MLGQVTKPCPARQAPPVPGRSLHAPALARRLTARHRSLEPVMVVRLHPGQLAAASACGERSGIIEICALSVHFSMMTTSRTTTDVPREDHLRRVRLLLGESPVVALVGPRQVGKTTLARRLAFSCWGAHPRSCSARVRRPGRPGGVPRTRRLRAEGDRRRRPPVAAGRLPPLVLGRLAFRQPPLARRHSSAPSSSRDVREFQAGTSPVTLRRVVGGLRPA